MYTALKKIMPSSIRGKLRKMLMKEIKRERSRVLEAIPKYELKQIHLRNLKVLTDRIALLDVLPKNGVVAEIGVNKGEFSEEIIRRNHPSKLHLIDLWDSERYH